jgi:hypothetical protein
LGREAVGLAYSPVAPRLNGTMKGETLNALTRFFADGAETIPGAAPLSSKSAPSAGRKKLTASEGAELLEILRDSDLVASAAEGQAAALYQRRARLIEEIEQALDEGQRQAAALLRELKTARASREKLEAQLRAASEAEAQVVESMRIEQDGREKRIAGLRQELEKSADKRLDALRLWLERQVQETRAHGPGFVFLTSRTERAEANAKGEPTSGYYDRVVHKALGARLIALQAAHREVQALRLRVLTATELTDAITGLVASIPTIPAAASKMAALPPDMELPR